jgi:hypothetical protein
MLRGFIHLLLAALFVISVGLLIIGVVHASPIYIAQNDPVQFQMTHPAGYCWYFPDVAKEDDQKLYAIPATEYDRENYTCDLTSLQTANMPAQGYTLIYVYPSKLDTGKIPSEYLSDLSWKNESIVSLFGEVRDEKGLQPIMVMKDLKEMVAKSKLDHMDEYPFVVQPPLLTITSQSGNGWDHTIISGESNLANGTMVRIEVDENIRDTEIDGNVMKYYSFTNYTPVIRDYGEEKGTWSYNMHLPIQFMTPGWHTTNVYAGGLESSAMFPIYQGVTPAPTPIQYINYFGNGSIKPDVVTVTIVQLQTVYQDRWHTATLTPDITDALGGKVDYPYSSGDVIPQWVGIVGLLAIGGIALVKGYERK